MEWAEHVFGGEGRCMGFEGWGGGGGGGVERIDINWEAAGGRGGCQLDTQMASGT